MQLVSCHRNSGSYLSFAGVRDEPTGALMEKLEIVAPVLHELFLRVLASSDGTEPDARLSQRQRGIVRLAVAGMDDKAANSDAFRPGIPI